jgi:hypothetical protein
VATQVDLTTRLNGSYSIISERLRPLKKYDTAHLIN